MVRVLVVLTVTLLGLPADSGRISGRVVDPRTGAGIAAARVSIDAGARTVAADDEGRYQIVAVPAGSHTLTALVTGFSASSPVAVVVAEDGEVRVDIPYPLSLSAEVRGAAPPELPMTAAAAGRPTLSGRDIAGAVGGLDDIGRVLQFQPGVVATQDDRNDLVVRGGGSMETQVMADGFELPTASHFGTPGSSSGGISLVPSDVIERAAMATGGYSVAYGERASSLVAIDLQGASGVRFGGTASAGAGGVLALGRGPIGSSGGWLASARRSILETAISRGNTRAVPRYVDVFGRVSLHPGSRHELRALVLGASDRAEVEPIQSTRPSTTTDEQQLALAGVGLRSRWSAATRTSLTAAFSTNEVDAYRNNAGVIDGREVSRERELRVRAEVQQALGGGVELVGGAAWRRSNVSFDLQDTGYRNEYGIVVPPLRAIWRDVVSEPVGYLEVTAALGRGVRATAGLRAERPGTSGHVYATPRVRLQYDVTGQVRLTTSAGVYRQAVPFIWIAPWPANAALPPIRCALFTAGAEVRGPWGLQGAVETFVKRYEGYPVDPAQPPRVLVDAGAEFDVEFAGHLSSAGLVHGHGFDAAVSRAFGRHGAISTSYSHWRMTQRGLDSVWRASAYDIRHLARVIGAWHPAARWTISGSWRYASGRPYTPYDVAASIRANAGRYDRTQTNALRYTPYARADLRAERVFTPGRTAITVFAEVMNLSDHDNLYVYTWSRALKRPDPVYQWGRTPVAGVRVEF
jgi:hypothetical protein